jgi:DNA repair exonuclease SbcCD ATPase subunit
MTTQSSVTTATPSTFVTLLLDELRQSLEPKVSHMLADYQLFKETHEAVLQIPFVKSLLERQKACKCNEEPIQLEIIDVSPADAPNLDSIAEYINSTVGDDLEEADEEVQEADEEVQEADEEEQEVQEADEEVQEADEEEQEVQEADEEEQEADEEDQEADEEEQEADEEEQEADEEEQEEQEEQEVQEADEEEQEEQEVQEADEEEQEVQEADEEEQEADEVEVEQEQLAEKKDPEPEPEQEADESEEELELFEVEIKGKTYVTNDETNGDIYEYENDEVGSIIGTFKNGVAKMTKKPKPKSNSNK